MEWIDTVKDKFRECLSENTRVTVAVAAILLVLAALALAAGIIHEQSAVKNKEIILPGQIPYSAVEQFFPPKKGGLTEDYYFSREQSSSWSQSEFDRWFSVPKADSIETLGKANEKIADEIIGAAP